MNLPKIAIIIGTTRPGRFSEHPARWIADIAAKRSDLIVETVDLRDWPLPFYDEPKPLSVEGPKLDLAKRWGEKLDEFDGFIIVTAEYNHSIPAVLKNAIDYTFPQFNRKPVGFVGYGGVGAARAIEHLRAVLIELQAAPLRQAVHIGGMEYRSVARGQQTLDDYAYLTGSAGTMLDQLVWWAEALGAARERPADRQATSG